MAEKLARTRVWTTIADSRGVLGLVETGPHPPIVLTNGYGVIVGDLFCRRDNARVSAFSLEDTLALIEDGGALLVSEYWGAYGAILHDRGHDRLHVVRDPAASSRIFWSEIEPDAHIVFSHASDYVAAGLSAQPNEAWLRAFLVRPRAVSHATALQGVHELLAGERLTLTREERHMSAAWTPTGVRGLSAESFEQSAAMVRMSVVGVAGAWTEGQRCIVHRLSGGLDSSIVLAGMKEAGATAIECVNQFPEGQSEGDERTYARIAARHFGVTLHEIAFAPQYVNYERLSEIELMVSPSLADLSFGETRAVDAIVTLGGDLITSGQGGDQLFHRMRRPAIAADAYRDGLSWAALSQVIFDTARLSRCPIWDVLGALAIYGAMRRSTHPMRGLIGPELIASEGAIAAAEALIEDHPWLPLMLREAPARALRLNHIAGLEYYHHLNAITAKVAAAPVIAAQPIIELCLNIPPYVMTAGGQDRSLARAAFAALLPEGILKRQAKALTTRFHTAVVERQLSFIARQLVGGELERRGLIRGDALNTVLARKVLPEPELTDALITAFVAEMWLRRLDGAVRAAACPPSQCGAPSAD